MSICQNQGTTCNDVINTLGGETPDILSKRYILSTFGDHNPSRSELYNNDPLNVEKLLCGQYFL